MTPRLSKVSIERESPLRNRDHGRSSLSIFESQIASLPERTRQLLVLAALDKTEELSIIQSAWGSNELTLDLKPAESERLVLVNDVAQRLVFRHPLVRVAILERSTSSERRAANLVFAELLSDRPFLKALHLAEATIGPDESIATFIEESAEASLGSVNPDRVVSALLRSAEIGERGAPRGRRLASAAHISVTWVGRVSEAQGLLDDARRNGLDADGILLEAATSAYVMLNGDGDVETAHRMLISAFERSGARAKRAESFVAVLDALRYLALLDVGSDVWRTFHDVITQLPVELHPNVDVLAERLTDLSGSVFLTLADLDGVLVCLQGASEVSRALLTCSRAAHDDRQVECRETLWRVFRESQRFESGGPTLIALSLLCHDRFSAGDWDRTNELADTGIEIGDSLGNQLYAWLFHYYQALIAANRGNNIVMDQSVADVERWAGPRGVKTAASLIHHVKTQAAMSDGDFETAYQHSVELGLTSSADVPLPLIRWNSLNLVQSAVRTDRREEARCHSEALKETATIVNSPRTKLLVGASAAMVNGDEWTRELFLRSLETPGIEDWPFEVARVELLFGEYLRRGRAAIEAREKLSSALSAFERLGAGPWAERASNELRATGLKRPRRRWDSEKITLTTQEFKIASLAATGMTNKEIGESLFLSHRTIGAHLYQIFQKLGITSRAALRDALADLSEIDAHDPSHRSMSAQVR
jgi:DNA-binding CsgD family transcriptional regulator